LSAVDFVHVAVVGTLVSEGCDHHRSYARADVPNPATSYPDSYLQHTIVLGRAAAVVAQTNVVVPGQSTSPQETGHG
jgi:hypothetical protein